MATVSFTASSVDGFIADADNSLQWLFHVPQTQDDQTVTDFVAQTGAMVMGATTYQWMLGHHGYLDDPQRWEREYGDKRTWVLTHGDLPAVPGADMHVGPREAADLHPELVQAAGGRHVWVVGGGDVAGQFADARLLDDVQVAVAPVALGAGAPLRPRRLDRLLLASTRQVGQFALLTYQLRDAPTT